MSLSRRDIVASALAIPLARGPSRPPALVGAYTGNDLADAAVFARWFGRPADLSLVAFNQKSWDAFATSIPWITQRHSGRPNLWSVPLAAERGGFAGVAAGSWDRLFESCAARILAHAPPGPVLIRSGWEMNLPEQEQSAFRVDGRADPATWIKAYRRVAGIFRAASLRFRLVWCPNVGAEHLDPAHCWPGRDVVDLVGLDLYFNNRWDRTSDHGASVWKWHKAGAGGLDWLAALGRQQVRRLCLPEWGINDDRATAFADALIAWIGAEDLVFHGYWDSDAAIRTRLSAGRLPAIGQRYRSAFA